MPESRWYLTCSEGASSKFYEITVERGMVHRRWGRLPDSGGGQSKTTSHPSDFAARTEAQQLVDSKLAKGYTLYPVVQYEAAPVIPDLSDREAVEAWLDA